jgi:hypothetical protein
VELQIDQHNVVVLVLDLEVGEGQYVRRRLVLGESLDETPTPVWRHMLEVGGRRGVWFDGERQPCNRRRDVREVGL